MSEKKERPTEDREKEENMDDIFWEQLDEDAFRRLFRPPPVPREATETEPPPKGGEQ